MIGRMIGLAEEFSDGFGGEAAPRPLPDIADLVFARGGTLEKLMRLEHRKGQEAMALLAAQAFATDGALFVEAPTGVGKSLAYLVPGIAHAMASGRQMLVSTNTKALQEQIVNKDLELCRNVFAKAPGLEGFAGFKAALLMGKGNYVCGTRLREAIGAQRSIFKSSMELELDRIREWSQATPTGLLQELVPSPSEEIWEHISADSPVCNNRNCTPETCPYRRARQLVDKANVLIVNHSLLFALLGAGFHPRGETPGILHPADFAVIDEAHTVPAVATEYFGVRVSDYAIRRLLLRLYNPSTNKGVLLRCENPREATSLTGKTLGYVRDFFLLAADKNLMNCDIMRLCSPQWIEADLMRAAVSELVALLAAEAKRFGDGPQKDELQGASMQLASYMGAIQDCIDLDEPDHVYWIERTGRSGVVSLRSAPLDVAPHLRERLFSRKTSVVLTSATLGVGSDLRSFASKAGGDGAVLESVESPFDFASSMKVFVAEDCPAFEGNRVDAEWMADMTGGCALAVRGGSLVLFTSHVDMRAAAVKVEAMCREAGRPFLLQGRDGLPARLREQFARAGNAVLFGTDSFWTGIDVPGPALSQVIVTRLPFENPSHPIAEARAQWLAARGEVPFAALTLPEAVMKFRQGIGRLIRSKTDKGTLTILDSRVVNRPYGRLFLDAVPHKGFTRFGRDSIASRFKPLEA
jgi:ATP-dependent DNA helicase DinG